MNDLRSERVERREELTLLVNGRQIKAYAGETVLVALLAAGIKKFKQSSVLKEDRGPLCGMGVCYECLVTINGIPDQRACLIEVKNGMEITLDEN